MADVAQKYRAIDLGRVGLAAARRANIAVFVGLAHVVDNHWDGPPDFGRQLGCAYPLGNFHNPRIAFFLHRFGHRIGQGVGLRAFHRFKPKGTHAVELRLLEPLEQISESASVSPGKPTTKDDLIAISGANFAPTLKPFKHFGFIRGPSHGPEDGARGVLEGNVEIGVSRPSAIKGMTASTCG